MGLKRGVMIINLLHVKVPNFFNIQQFIQQKANFHYEQSSIVLLYKVKM